MDVWMHGCMDVWMYERSDAGARSKTWAAPLVQYGEQTMFAWQREIDQICLGVSFQNRQTTSKARFRSVTSITCFEVSVRNVLRSLWPGNSGALP